MKKEQLSKRVLSLILIVLLIGLIICDYYYEHQVRSDLKFFDIIENTVIILMGEYPNKPLSLGSRIVQLILLVFGTLLFGVLVGKFSSIYVLRSLRGNTMSNLEGHFIICNWNKNGKGIIEQLQKGNKKNESKIIIISTFEIKEDFENDNIMHIKEDPTNHSTLRKYNASKATTIILLADENISSPDERNALIALAIKYLEGEKKLDIRVVAELINPDLKKHLQDAGVDEVICSADYSSGIIAQSAIFSNMSEIYHRLLTYSESTNEIYMVENISFNNKTFLEVADAIAKKHNKKPVILLGIKRGDEILLNPKKETIIKISDKLIVLSYYNIDKF